MNDSPTSRRQAGPLSCAPADRFVPAQDELLCVAAENRGWVLVPYVVGMRCVHAAAVKAGLPDEK